MNILVHYFIKIYSEFLAKLRIFSGISVTIWLQNSKEHGAAIYHEYTAVANLAALAGGKQLDVAPASVKIVSQ